jgi:hypothetical protein
VTGIGKKGERSREKAANDLHHREGRDHGEGDPEPCHASHPVVVVVGMVGAVTTVGMVV